MATGKRKSFRVDEALCNAPLSAGEFACAVRILGFWNLHKDYGLTLEQAFERMTYAHNHLGLTGKSTRKSSLALLDRTLRQLRELDTSETFDPGEVLGHFARLHAEREGF